MYRKRVLKCGQCGCEFEGTGAKWCSSVCRHLGTYRFHPRPKKERRLKSYYQRRLPEKGTCEECGGAFLGRKGRRWCSRECNYRFWHPMRREARAPLPRWLPLVATCEWCSVTFLSNTWRQRFCSEAHERAAYRLYYMPKKAAARKPAAPRVVIRECVACGVDFVRVGRIGAIKWCLACLAAQKACRICAGCGVEIIKVGHVGPDKWCDRCRPLVHIAYEITYRASSRYAPIKRVSVLGRRARKIGASGAADASAIAARWSMWGGQCWMCGALASATDHVKPLAKGGSNWAANLRPACRSCNSSKGDRWPFAGLFVSDLVLAHAS